MKYRDTIWNWLIACVWLINGLFCKVLDLVPRHRLIVARILGDEYAKPLTVLIGLLETCMAVWILSGFSKKLNVLSQIVLIAGMNTLEFFLAPDLLLWGRLNALFAFFFVVIIYYRGRYSRPAAVQYT